MFCASWVSPSQNDLISKGSSYGLQHSEIYKLEITKQYKYFLQCQKQNKSLLNEYLFKTNHRQRNFPAARHIYMINPCLSSLIIFQSIHLKLHAFKDCHIHYCPGLMLQSQILSTVMIPILKWKDNSFYVFPNTFLQSKIPQSTDQLKGYSHAPPPFPHLWFALQVL